MYIIGSSLSCCRKRARQGVLHAASPTSPIKKQRRPELNGLVPNVKRQDA
jgi:hypothetical protein